MRTFENMYGKDTYGDVGINPLDIRKQFKKRLEEIQKEKEEENPAYKYIHYVSYRDHTQAEPKTISNYMILIKPKTSEVWQFKTFPTKATRSQTEEAFTNLYMQGVLDFGDEKDIINFFKGHESLELIKLKNLSGNTMYMCPRLKEIREQEKEEAYKEALEEQRKQQAKEKIEVESKLPPEYIDKIFWVKRSVDGGTFEEYSYIYMPQGKNIYTKAGSNNETAIKKSFLQHYSQNASFADIYKFIYVMHKKGYTVMEVRDINKTKILYPFPPPKVHPGGNTKIYYAKLITKTGTVMQGYFYIYILPGRNYYEMAHSNNIDSIKKSKLEHQNQNAGFGNINKFIKYCQSKGFIVVEVTELLEPTPDIYVPPEPHVYVPPTPIYIPPTPTLLDQTKCFIATATFGTEMMPEINVLRYFRDNTLHPNPIGKKSINIYYTISPYIAKLIIKSEKLRAITRIMLNPIVKVFKRRS